jgi:hypothetical protein
MNASSTPNRHPVLLKVLSVIVALGFLGAVMCTASGGGADVPRPVEAEPAAARDGGSGSADAGTDAASVLNASEPASEKFFPATKAGPLEVFDRAPPTQAVPQREEPQQVVPK